MILGAIIIEQKVHLYSCVHTIIFIVSYVYAYARALTL